MKEKPKMKVKLNEDRVHQGQKHKKGSEVEVDNATGFRWINRRLATKVKTQATGDSKKKSEG